VTKRARLISINRELLIEKLQLPERLHPLHTVRRIAWYRGQLRQGVGKDLVNFRLDPFYFLFQT
jgi:hypothetical protein